MKIAAVVLVVIGVVVLVYQGFTYTTRETVLDIGPIHATADKQHNIPLSPVLGVMALVAGAALLVVGGRSV